MWQGFKINIEDLKKHSKNLVEYKSDELIYNKIDRFQISNLIFEAYEGTIESNKIINEFFPKQTPHIFISHSSKDIKSVIQFANYLYDNFNIVSFIDSQFWKYVDDAIAKLNDKYSFLRKERDGTKTYKHKKCNIISCNMYLMLSNELMKTMDNSDSVIFIDSENSIYKNDEKLNKKLNEEKTTLSPWIYSEINFFNYLKPKYHKDRSMRIRICDSAFSSESYQPEIKGIIYPLKLENFLDITQENLTQIFKLEKKCTEEDYKIIENLDLIYKALGSKAKKLVYSYQNNQNLI